MIFRNGIKQQLRMRTSSAACFALIWMAVAFLIIGLNLWETSVRNMRAYENAFTAIGVVSQKEDAVQVRRGWDAGSKQNILSDQPAFNSYQKESMLYFEGADYIIPPIQRPYYLADLSGYRIRNEESERLSRDGFGEIIVFEPEEDCTPTEPVRVKVIDSVWGASNPADYRWLCDHYNEQPGMLRAGQRYIAHIVTFSVQHTDANPKAYSESIPEKRTDSTQVTREGASLYGIQPLENWDEVSEGFYESEAWSKWKETMHSLDRFLSSVPVIPTDGTKLLLDFHQGEAYFREGRDIMPEEYEDGDRVCLIPSKLAERSGLKVGDAIKLPLYLADYKNPPSKVFFPSSGMNDGSIVLNYKLLNADGKAYPVFESNAYEIVGIYNRGGNQNALYSSGFELPDNGIIVPRKTIRNSDDNNIAAAGPMQASTTSFQIPNGTALRYTEKFDALGIPNLEITFYDGGYEQLKAGMDDLKAMGLILALSGGAAALAVLFLFVILSVHRQRVRTAIERSLGVTKRRCLISLLIGLLIVTLPGVLLGGICGHAATDWVLGNMNEAGTASFSTAFSNWVNNADAAVSVDLAGATPWTAVWACLAIMGMILAISLAAILSSLRAEPQTILCRGGS